MTNNVQQLALVIQQILSQTNELRVLIHECYAPFIIGQLGSRAKMLKDKYSLTNVKVRKNLLNLIFIFYFKGLSNMCTIIN